MTLGDHVLMAVWWTTVVLAAISLLAMAGLIIHRSARNRRAARVEARRKELCHMAMELLGKPDRLPELEARLEPGDRALLLGVFTELVPRIRGEYANRMVNLMRTLGLMEDCLQRVKDPAWWKRAEACMALSHFRDPNVTLALYRALEDNVAEVRVEAARALARLGAVRSVTELVEPLVGNEEVPSLQVTELFRSLGRAAVPELLRILENHAKVCAKIIAADALGWSGDLNAVEPLLRFYDHPSTNLRLTVMQALARLRDPQALTAVMLTLVDPAWEVRAQAAFCAGQIGAAEAVPLLEQLLTDEHWWVRYYAAEALFKIGDPGVEALRKAAQLEDASAAAEMAAGMLQEKGVLV